MFYRISVLLVFTFISLGLNYYRLASQLILCWGWDIISSRIISLTLWIIALICLCESNYITKIILIIATLIVFFTTKNIWFFFMYFEFSIIPILLIVILKGNQPERLEAGIRLLLYTFTARTALFFSILNLYSKINSWNFINVTIVSWEIIILMIIAFLVKLPIWRIHIWLPKAHVEAPVGGSIILAAILLKLGVYGLYRLILIRVPEFKSRRTIIASIGLVGILIRAIICFISTDLKVLIAYSSVSHISPILLILINFNSLRLTNVIILSLSHGFTSSLIFFTGNLIYINRKTRLLIIQKGNILSNSLVTLILFWRIIINLAVPPFFPFFSEVLRFILMFIQRIRILPIIFIIVILSGLYNTYLFIRIGFGKEKAINTKKITLKETNIFFMHIIPLIIVPFIL